LKEDPNQGTSHAAGQAHDGCFHKIDCGCTTGSDTKTAQHRDRFGPLPDKHNGSAGDSDRTEQQSQQREKSQVAGQL
jgi:hypothetical protein